MQKARIQEALFSYGEWGLGFPWASEPLVDLLRQGWYQLAGVTK